jgi:imidazole glycerol-phosphate synthase subunit HisH
MISIIDYGVGNLSSVLNAFEYLKIPAKITNNINDIKNSSKIVLPGVGAFEEGMKGLKKNNLIEVLNDQVLNKKKLFLGICLGMQLICKKSYENGEFEGLNWIDAEVIKFNVSNKKLRVPHIGWNDVKCNLKSPLFKNGLENQTFYFVHSYYVVLKNNKFSIGTCNYDLNFCASLQKENIFATQFHPEKSQYEGLEILKKFALIKDSI